MLAQDLDSELRVSLDAQSSLFELWLDTQLVDVVVVASDGHTLGAHKVVLAAASRFFRALFTGAWQQQQQLQHGDAGGSGGAWPPHAQRVSLSGVDGPGLHLLLHAIYSKRLPLTAEGAAEEAALLLGAANYLEVLPVKAACCRFLRSQLSLETVAETLALAAAHDCTELLEDASRFFEGHFSQLLKCEDAAASLAVLPPDLLRALLSSDGLTLAGSELDVARAALLWAAPDPQQRGPLLAELLSAARMPPRQILEQAAAGGLLGPAGAALSGLLLPQHGAGQQMQTQQQPMAVAAAAPALQSACSTLQQQQHHQQQQQSQQGDPQGPSLLWQQQQQQAQHEPSPPSPRTPHRQAWEGEWSELGMAFQAACQQLESSKWAAASAAAGVVPVGAADVGPVASLACFRPRLCSPTGLMMAGGLDDGWRSLRTVELYDSHKDRWSPGPMMPAPCSFAAGAMLGRHTLVVEGAAHSPHVLAFDRQQHCWGQRSTLGTPRVNMAVAALEGRLFVMGGRAGIGKGAAVLADVEIFDPLANSWSAGPPMAAPRTSLAAASLGGRLYVVGGQDNRSTHASCEAFDPGAGRWVALGPGGALQQPRKYLALAAAAGRLIAVGGMTGARLRLSSAEALDPREGRWCPLPPMSVARSSCGAAELHGSVFVVGGNVGQDIHQNCAGVEAWVPSAGRWRACASTSHGQAGAAVAPF